MPRSLYVNLNQSRDNMKQMNFNNEFIQICFVSDGIRSILPYGLFTPKDTKYKLNNFRKYEIV